jgi:hypothetical protein
MRAETAAYRAERKKWATSPRLFLRFYHVPAAGSTQEWPFSRDFSSGPVLNATVPKLACLGRISGNPQRVDPVAGTSDIGTLTAELVNVRGEITRYLADPALPLATGLSTTMGVRFMFRGFVATAPASADAGVVLLGDGSGYPKVGHLTIDAEDIAYTGYTVVPGGTAGNELLDELGATLLDELGAGLLDETAGQVTTDVTTVFTGLTRGGRGTTIQPHAAGTLVRNGEQIRRGQRVTAFLGYGPLDEEDYGPGPGYVKLAVEAVDSTVSGLGWTVRAADIQRFVKQSVFTGATSDFPVILGPDHPINLALKVLTSTGTPGVNGPYDTLPAHQGAAVPQTLVAIDILELLRDAVFPGLQMEFRAIDLEDAKQFVEGQCFRPLGLVPFITQRGRYGARPLRLPLFARSGFMVRHAFRAAA